MNRIDKDKLKSKAKHLFKSLYANEWIKEYFTFIGILNDVNDIELISELGLDNDIVKSDDTNSSIYIKPDKEGIILAKIEQSNKLSNPIIYRTVYYYDNKWYDAYSVNPIKDNEKVLDWKYINEIF